MGGAKRHDEPNVCLNVEDRANAPGDGRQLDGTSFQKKQKATVKNKEIHADSADSKRIFQGLTVHCIQCNVPVPISAVG